MAFRPFAILRGSTAALALCASLAVAVVIGTTGSDRLVQSGFDKALTTRSLSIIESDPASVAQAQPEEFWLRNAHARPIDVKPVAWTGQLSRGDRLTFSQGSSGTPRTLEVIEATPLALDATRLDLAPEGSQLLAITCRDVSRSDTPLVRIIITEGALPFIVHRSGEKALL